jgi:hypothetical protein
MDNLFNSVKLFQGLYKANALAHGVVRTSNRGVPDLVLHLNGGEECQVGREPAGNDKGGKVR